MNVKENDFNVEKKEPELYLVDQTSDGNVSSLQKLLNSPKYNGYKVIQVLSIERSIGSCYSVIFKWDK